MLRLPVSRKFMQQRAWTRSQSSSSFIRNTFIEYFVRNHGHKQVKSSSVVPLYDSTVPFVNAGMNQFKGVFLGTVEAPCLRAVNSQKCIRVGGKHNDLAVVGTDGHHHTFFEMLGNWSFGDYYKKEACQMAWDLLLGPYRLKPENLVVTYFGGDVVMDLIEDRECRDVWLNMGIPKERVIAKDASDNFWEMGAAGPCGPCTEVHHVNSDGSLTEIWNIVFIQCNRLENGKVRGLRKQHVDTGMGLERMAALLQGASSNYDTDLFQPLIEAIEKGGRELIRRSKDEVVLALDGEAQVQGLARVQSVSDCGVRIREAGENSKGVNPYSGKYGADASLDAAYRRLADHSRMISICLADGVFPATSLNLKQILRKSIRISTDTFNNPHLLPILYEQVVETLGEAYPELVHKTKDAKLIIAHETESYAKLRSNLAKKWKDLAKQYPEVEKLSDIESAGFAQGYRLFKETMAKHNSNTIPGELVFKLYDTHGFQEDTIERIAKLNELQIDTKGFWKLLKDHKAKHKTALQEQADDKGLLFEQTIDQLRQNGYTRTDDQFKYNYRIQDHQVVFPALRAKVIAILNEDLVWIDCLEVNEDSLYYFVTDKSNFYCEEGGQVADLGTIKVSSGITLRVNSVFKIRDFVFYRGYFKIDKNIYQHNSPCVKNEQPVELIIDSDRRMQIMRNHTAVHLLNAAVREVLTDSVVCQIGSSVTEEGLSLNLSVYGQKLSEDVVLQAQDLVRKAIQSNAPIETRVVDSMALAREQNVLTVGGEAYPETGIRLVSVGGGLGSRELCCGTHVPKTGMIGSFVVTTVKGAGGNTPHIHALAGDRAAEARELFCRAQKLLQVVDLIDPSRKSEETAAIRTQLQALCAAGGAPYGEYARCLALLDSIAKRDTVLNDAALMSVAEEELRSALDAASQSGRSFVVHFLRCSYLMQPAALATALRGARSQPGLLLGCAGGTIIAAARVPEELVTERFSAEKWLRCILPVFHADLEPTGSQESPLTYAQMTGTKVSLITCEQLVQDAMRVAIKYAQSHVHAHTWDSGQPSQDRRKN